MGDADSTFSASDPCWSAEETAHMEASQNR